MRLRFAWIGGLLCAAWLATTAAGVAAAAEGRGTRVAGALEALAGKIEAELAADIAGLPEIPAALDREWRSFDRDGSAWGALAGVSWVVLATLIAMAAQWATARGLGRRLRRSMRARPEAPGFAALAGLLLCDAVGLVVFLAVFQVEARYWLSGLGVGEALTGFAADVLLRWRCVALVIAMLLRPADPAARLIEVGNVEARRLSRFLSTAILAIIVIVGFGRYGLADEDSGAAHVIGLINALIVCGLYVVVVFRARRAAEAMIRGRRTAGIAAAIRAGLARLWVPLALAAVVFLLVFFVAGLSVGMLSYYHAVASTLGTLFLLLVLDCFSERAGHDAPVPPAGAQRGEFLLRRAGHRVLRAAILLAAAIMLAWIWTAALAMTGAAGLVRSLGGAAAVLFVAYAGWQLVNLAIERNLAPAAVASPLDAEDGEIPTATRLQTALPFLRAALAVAIGVLAVLVILSRLGVDTAPLIAGAGVFGLAISFGSQSLVRDIISGLFFMWDDAFRVGEYIDTGRLRGTVEGMSIRSVKLRHHNGPLHTIPYGQLGAVSNLSRDWVILKFNLRLERGSDIELVRKTVKQIGIQMQDEPEIAAEVLQPLKLQGIVEFADTALVVRLKFTARPIKPSWVQREYLKRIYKVFPEKGIAFASGALTLQTLQGLPPLDSAAAPTAPALPPATVTPHIA